MRSQTYAWIVCLGGAAALGCGGGDDGDSPSSTGGAPAGGGNNAGANNTGGSSGGSGGMGTAGMGTAGTRFTESGVCGQRASAKANATTFEGTQEYYIVADRGFGEEICVVRFDLKRVGEPPAACAECPWAHTLEFSNPTVVLDTDGVCGKSEQGFTTAKLDAISGTRGAFGFMEEFVGHDLGAWMQYKATSQMWEPLGNASWDPEGHEFSFNNIDGDCAY